MHQNQILALVIGVSFMNNVQIGGTPQVVAINAIDGDGKIKATFLGYTPDVNLEQLANLKEAKKYNTLRDLLESAKKFINGNTLAINDVQYVGDHYQTVAGFFQQLVDNNLLDKPQVPKANMVDIANLVSAKTRHGLTTIGYAVSRGIPVPGNGKAPLSLIDRIQVEGSVYALITSEQLTQSTTSMKREPVGRQAATA